MIKKFFSEKKTVGALALFITAIIVSLLLLVLQSNSGIKKSMDSDKKTKAVRMLPAVNAPIKAGTTLVPDFGDIYNVRERKLAFFSYLLPAIQAENEYILAQRETLTRLHGKVLKGQALTAKENSWIDDLSKYYRVETNDRSKLFNTLLRRVDIVPETLVLIQAANESGWGTSRFARNARNFFGQWCWTEGCGIVPEQRPNGERYEVRLFDSMEASVKSYVRNLNTHSAYHDLRSIRRKLRLNEQPVTAVPLSAGLISYSTRGEDYINELQQMIHVNRPIIEAARNELDDEEIIEQ